MLTCHDFRRGRKVAEVNCYIFFSNNDLISNAFNDLSLFFVFKFWPTGVEVSSLVEDMFTLKEDFAEGKDIGSSKAKKVESGENTIFPT